MDHCSEAAYLVAVLSRSGVDLTPGFVIEISTHPSRSPMNRSGVTHAAKFVLELASQINPQIPPRGLQNPF